MRILKNIPLLCVVMLLALCSCQKKYAYVETLGDNPNVEIIDAGDDAAAYDDAFEKFAQAQLHYVFDPYIKTKKYADYEGGCEDDEEGTECAGNGRNDEGGNNDDNGGDNVVTDDSDSNAETPQYSEPNKDNVSFMLYKLDNGDATDAAKKLKAGKITLAEFQKIMAKNATEIDLFDQQIDKCKKIYKAAFDSNMAKLKATK